MIGFAENIDKEIKALKINTSQKDTLLGYSAKIVELVNNHEDQSKLKEVSASAKRFLLLNTGLKKKHFQQTTLLYLKAEPFTLKTVQNVMAKKVMERVKTENFWILNHEIF